MNEAQTAIVTCSACDQKNRLKERVGRGSYKCGKCGALINSPFRYVIFDTETTGLPSGRGDPYLVQLAWSVHEPNGTAIEEHCYIIKPNGFSIPQASTNVHGITDDVARVYGVDVQSVISRFLDSATYAHSRLVAHNIDFDIRVLTAELQRIGSGEGFPERPQFCTMKSTVDLCKLPKRGAGYKWPSLQELHLHLFGKPFVDAHNALSDVRATASCFFELMRQKLCRFG